MDTVDTLVSNHKSSKKNGRNKSKKQLEHEMMEDYYNEYGKFNTISTVSTMKSKYENMQYLSYNEKQSFETKFTKPTNSHQVDYVHALKQRSKKIVIVSGPAGTGKTLFATEFGIKGFLTGDYEKLIFTRPSVTVDEDLGYLPGSLEEKMAPWVRPIYDILYRFVPPIEVQNLIANKQIEISPLGFMRGRTFKNAWIIADEMQNSTVPQMKMLMTRLGEGSRLVVTGDLEQHDRGPGEVNGLEDFLDKFRGRRSSSISSFEFNKDDIQREEVVREVLDIYSATEVPRIYKSSTPSSNSSVSSNP